MTTAVYSLSPLYVLVLCTVSVALRAGPLTVPIKVTHEWPTNNFGAEFCITAPSPIYGPWTIMLTFDQPIKSIEIWQAKYNKSSEDQKQIYVTNQEWADPWQSDVTKCINFNGVKLEETGGKPTGTAQFVDLEEAEDCHVAESGQNIEIRTVAHWKEGLQAEVCLTVPRHMDGWKIRLELSQTIPGGLEVWGAKSGKSKDNKVWILKPKRWNKKLTAGDRFCFMFTAKTKEFMSPCIDAYFARGKGNKPIPPSFTTTTTTTAEPTTSVEITTTPLSTTVFHSTTEEASTTSTSEATPQTHTTTSTETTSTTTQAAESTTTGEKSDEDEAVMALFRNSFSGDGTYYGGGTGGTCSYGANNPPKDNGWEESLDVYIALNKPQFMKSVTCGMCLIVSGSGEGLGNSPITGEHLVFVNNLCPECHEGSVDFGISGDGRWEIDIQAVQCPVGNTNIQYSFQGSHQWYVKLQVRNARIPITSLELKKGDQWVSPAHSDDGYWVATGMGEWPTGPLPVKMTAANGEVLYDEIPRIETTSSVLDGLKGVQVAKDTSLPSA